MKDKEETCTWTPQFEGWVSEYDTDCGDKFLSEYSPYKFKFCPFCGKRIEFKED